MDILWRSVTAKSFGSRLRRRSHGKLTKERSSLGARLGENPARLYNRMRECHPLVP